MDEVAEGANYRIAVDDEGIVWCTVWKRPDISRDAGARCAVEQVGVLTHLAQSSDRPRAALVFDLSRAPEVWGPATHGALGTAWSAWEAARRPLRVVVGPDLLQRISVRSLLRSSAPSVGALCVSTTEARESLRAAFAPVDGAA